MKSINRINVTKTFLPPINEYNKYLKTIWDNGIITNRGELLVKFEKKISEYTGESNFQFVTNGTIALQLAIDALGVNDGEIITTPFSYVATTSAILWQKAKPVFVDIDPMSFNIDVNKIEEAINEKTKAILAVHVFGNPCDVEKIEKIAQKYNIKIIYDAAHAFGVTFKNRSILAYGDISITSFHATKVFHTIEGGGIFAKNLDIHNKIDLKKRFGHNGDTHLLLGINAKASEFQAAMGICNLKYLGKIISNRKLISDLYDSLLSNYIIRPVMNKSIDRYNYSYYPVLFKDENELMTVVKNLNLHEIYPRRYFYPSLNKLPYISYKESPVSERIAKTILCLPIYDDLSHDDVCKISTVVINSLNELRK